MNLEALYAAGFVVIVAVAFGIFGRYAGRSELAVQTRDAGERTALRTDVARLTAERNYWYSEAQKSDRRAGEAENRAAAAERELSSERALRLDAERSVARGEELFTRLDEMQAEITRLLAEVQELRRARPAT